MQLIVRFNLVDTLGNEYLLNFFDDQGAVVPRLSRP
ncbi:hypothetical protein LCGC14_2613740, partial [marine sediment metagenome]